MIAMVMTHIHATGQGQRSIGLKVRVETGALEVDNFMRYINLLTYLLTYGRRRLHYLPC